MRFSIVLSLGLLAVSVSAAPRGQQVNSLWCIMGNGDLADTTARGKIEPSFEDARRGRMAFGQKSFYFNLPNFATFATRKAFSSAWRQRQLLLLKLLGRCKKITKLSQTLSHDADVGKLGFEGYMTGVNLMLDRAIISAKRVPEWAAVKNGAVLVFYTGNGTVARIIAAAAAEHPTPPTRELEGRSPRISRKHMHLSTDGSLIFDSYARVINMQHFNRIKSLLERTQGKVLIDGGMDEKERRIEATIVLVKPGDVLLESETFVPILTLLEVDDIRAACDYISAKFAPQSLL
ncbi:hypothetical protein F5051DRAFT_470406 [Lentinula edodes]|nr:hypothetical protein F5051DRAFT_470406 [Lentinula edodes]